MLQGFVLSDVHLYIGAEMYPENNGGKPTVAPGQYPYQDGSGGNPAIPGEGVNTYTFQPVNVTSFTDGFYVIFHGVTCSDDSAAKTASQQSLKVTPYPTVFDDEINISVEVENPTVGMVGVYGMNGSKLKAETHQLNKGRNELRLNLSSLSGSVYILEVQTLDGQKVLKKIMAR
jgi:hypothetical protein